MAKHTDLLVHGHGSIYLLTADDSTRAALGRRAPGIR
jgi:hypothetical protein